MPRGLGNPLQAICTVREQIELQFDQAKARCHFARVFCEKPRVDENAKTPSDSPDISLIPYISLRVKHCATYKTRLDAMALLVFLFKEGGRGRGWFPSPEAPTGLFRASKLSCIGQTRSEKWPVHELPFPFVWRVESSPSKLVKPPSHVLPPFFTVCPHWVHHLRSREGGGGGQKRGNRLRGKQGAGTLVARI